MPQLKGWGVRELNPTIWLTVWRQHVMDYIEKRYQFQEEEEVERPARSSRFTVQPVESLSPQKQARYYKAGKQLFKDLTDGDNVDNTTIPDDSDVENWMANECDIDPRFPTQYCRTHGCKSDPLPTFR